MPPVAATLLILTPPQESLVKYKAVVIWTLQSCHGAQEWDTWGTALGGNAFKDKMFNISSMVPALYSLQKT